MNSMPAESLSKPRLAVVMPVYNEQDCIVAVIDSWREVLSGLEVNYRILVLNDGSQDRTAEELARFDGAADVEIVHKPNSGHGPTVMHGYRQALEWADWIFQCDSDDELEAVHFPEIWHHHSHCAAVFGIRSNRDQGPDRRFISAVSRLIVRLLGGHRVTDVNVPYRLMRSDALRRIVDQIPTHVFAPNVIISGAFSRSELPMENVPIPFRCRRTGEASIASTRLWRAAIISFFQTLRYRPRLDKGDLERKPRAGK
jgi:dolichol-phosphate mannosyltransferase